MMLPVHNNKISVLFPRGLNALNFQPAFGWISGHTSHQVETDSARNGECLDEFSLPPCGWRRRLGVYWWLTATADPVSGYAPAYTPNLRTDRLHSTRRCSLPLPCRQPDR